MNNEIEKLYSNYFSSLEINPKTGLFNNSELKVRFATFPYIGEKYNDSKRKILFIGLDIGKDEAKYIKELNERRGDIAKDYGFNDPHISGTYTSALYFLKDIYGWNDIWKKITVYPTSQQATKTKQHNNNENPLHYIALTNYFKFVGVDRKNRSGDGDRRYLNKNAEKQLLLDEIKILKPDLLIFQGDSPYRDVYSEIKEMKIQIMKAWHPSIRRKGCRQPQKYVENIFDI